MERRAKKKNGRILDGKTWDEMPAAKNRFIRAESTAIHSVRYEYYAGILCKNKSALRARFNGKKIGIFESHVRGEQKRRSDPDIPVEYYVVPDLFTFINPEMHLSKSPGIEVDLIRKEGIMPELKEQIPAEVNFL